MKNFQKYYQKLFDVLGYPLSKKTAIDSKSIAQAEKRLEIKVPPALRDYYLVAGKERQFNCCLNRLLPPKEWSVDKGRLLFMEENQAVVWWGVPVRNPKLADPMVWQGVNDDTITWASEHRRCSTFLAVTLHYHAVSGGYRFCSQARAPEKSSYRFEKNGWTYHGEVGEVSAYSRQNQVVCLMPPDDLPFMPARWTILAGAKTKDALSQIGDELEVKFAEN